MLHMQASKLTFRQMHRQMDRQIAGQKSGCMNPLGRNGMQVLMMLHEDEDYQRDVGDAQVMDAILNDVKQHPEKLQK